MTRIYLDNAATSWPKPPGVVESMAAWQQEIGAAYGRGSGAAGDATARLVGEARRLVATLLGESDPRRVVFAASGTDALHTALFGTLREGDHVVATSAEHNAVLRSLMAMAEGDATPGVEATWVGCDRDGCVTTDELIAAMRPETRLVAVTHASNVTGAVQPIETIAAAKPDDALLLVDAAQTVGRWPLDVRTLGADLIAAPGHKGLMGPLGTGVLWIGPRAAERMRPVRFGGAASGGGGDALPDRLPDRYEVGNLNVPGLVGLAAAVRHVAAEGVATTRNRIGATRRRLAAGLASIDGVRVYGPDEPDRQAGVVAFGVAGYAADEFALLLAQAGVECRAGLHCAPRLHDALGTRAGGGLVRFSPGPTTTDAEIDAAIAAVREFASA